MQTELVKVSELALHDLIIVVSPYSFAPHTIEEVTSLRVVGSEYWVNFRPSGDQFDKITRIVK